MRRRSMIAAAVVAVGILISGSQDLRISGSSGEAFAVPRAHSVCNTKACERRVARRQARHRAWLREQRWRRLQRMLPPETKRMLKRLRGCETRGIPFPHNYRWNGHHHGAYQYAWGSRGSAGERAGFTVRPGLASPAEQDVRTARFYPSHRSEWACRA